MKAVELAAGLDIGLAARSPGEIRLEHAAPADRDKLVGLDEVIERALPCGAPGPEKDRKAASAAAAQGLRRDRATAFEVGVIEDPVLPAVAVEILDPEKLRALMGAAPIRTALPLGLLDDLSHGVGLLGGPSRYGGGYYHNETGKLGQSGHRSLQVRVWLSGTPLREGACPLLNSPVVLSYCA